MTRHPGAWAVCGLWLALQACGPAPQAEKAPANTVDSTTVVLSKYYSSRNYRHWLGDLQAMGVPAEWAPHVAAAGFDTPEAIREAKPAALREKLNGFRKKNKLDLPALQLEDVESWSA